MQIISFIVLILLSLVGYCAGAVGKAGKTAELKPQIVDLALVSGIWAAAIYSRIILDLNKWLVILIWVILGMVIGVLAVLPRKLSVEEASSNKEPKEASRNLLERLWQNWGDFSKRMGGFQSRIILSLFFLILVLPLALGVKVFSDPLRLKHRSGESHWLLRMETEADLEQSKRQF